MLTDEEVTQLAEFMGWHLSKEYFNDDYITCWVSSEDEISIPLDWWNPDSDMSDAFLLLDKVGDRKQEFLGYLASLMHKHDGEEFSTYIDIFELTPELICRAVLLLK